MKYNIGGAFIVVLLFYNLNYQFDALMFNIVISVFLFWYHYLSSEFRLQVLMMMMMMMMILSLNHLDKIVLCVMTILHIHPQMKKNYVLLFSQRLLFFHVDIPSIATACCLSHLKSSPRIHHVLFV